MKNIFKQALLIISFMLLTVSVNVSFSQVPPPQPPNNGSGGNQGPSAPIDGGLGIALAMVAGYGAYKLLRARQKKQAVR